MTVASITGMLPSKETFVCRAAVLLPSIRRSEISVMSALLGLTCSVADVATTHHFDLQCECAALNHSSGLRGVSGNKVKDVRRFGWTARDAGVARGRALDPQEMLGRKHHGCGPPSGSHLFAP